MRKILRIELKRVWKNPQTWVALAIGFAVSVFHLCHNILPHIEIWYEELLIPKSDYQYPYYLFNSWICGSAAYLEGFIYFFIIPLLAVLPCGLSFMEDRENGYIRQIYTHAERREYLTAKTITSFITGGTVVTLPLLFNFLICAMLLPALYPQNMVGTFVNADVLWFRLYERYPLVYVLIFLVMDFIYAGLCAALPLFFSYYSDRKFIVLLMPFVIHMFSYSVGMMLPSPQAIDYTPPTFLFAAYGCPSWWPLLLYGGVYFMMGGPIFWNIGKKEDIF